MISYFQTDVGNVRSHNEDCVNVFSNNVSTLAVVADGMGGHRAGDLASSLAVENVRKSWERLTKVSMSPSNVEEWMASIIEDTNLMIYNHSTEHPECEGMGTTIVLAYCTSTFVTVGHIGDSRCYVSNQLRFTQLTEDHTYVNFLVKSGEVNLEEAELHPKKHVLIRALGTEPFVKSDIKTVSIGTNDTILLCSDGLCGMVCDNDIKAVIDAEASLREKTEKLVRIAKDNGGNDNISVAIVKNIAVEMEIVE